MLYGCGLYVLVNGVILVKLKLVVKMKELGIWIVWIVMLVWVIELLGKFLIGMLLWV